jgi:ribosomal protein S16
MTKEELVNEAEKSLDKRLGTYAYIRKQDCYTNYVDGYIDSAEPREKQIQIDAEQIRALQKQNGELTDKVKELKAQIEKMKSDVMRNVKWADQNKNEQMYCKLNAMFNQWEIKK